MLMWVAPRFQEVRNSWTLTVTNKLITIDLTSAGRLISNFWEALRVGDEDRLGVGNKHPHRI